MTGLDIILLPDELKEKDFSDCLAVVIDVLRASSTITTALASGAERIIPVYMPKQAQDRADNYPADKVLLGGERNGEKITDFDLGNSPREYNHSRIKGKTILLSTTNGIRAIELVKEAKQVIIGCFLNSKSVAEYCLSYPGKVLLVCAGDRGNLSLEDTVCAGMIGELCLNCNNENEYYLDDSLAASIIYRNFANNFINMFKESLWGRNLIEMGLEKDISFCAQKDIYDIVPVIKDDSIIINSESAEKN